MRLDLNKAKRALHSMFGIDWVNTDSYKICEGEGKFTVKAIEKQFGLSIDKLNIIIVSSDEGGWKRNRVAKILSDGTVDIDVKTPWGVLDSFYAKKDFESIRKKDNISWVLIQVDKNSLTNCISDYDRKKAIGEKFMNSLSMRIRNVVPMVWCTSNGDRYIGGIDKADYGNVEISRISFHSNKTKDINEVVDKSGYNVALYRRNLAYRLADLKKKKLSKAIRSDFYEKELVDLKIMLEAKKVAIQSELVASNSKESISTIADRLKNLSWQMRYYENLVANVNELKQGEQNSYRSGFTSNDSFAKLVIELKDKIEKI